MPHDARSYEDFILKNTKKIDNAYHLSNSYNSHPPPITPRRCLEDPCVRVPGCAPRLLYYAHLVAVLPVGPRGVRSGPGHAAGPVRRSCNDVRCVLLFQFG
jgi:hypothetical protein